PGHVGDDLQQGGPLEGVDAGPTPHGIVGTDPHHEVQPAATSRECQPVVAGDVLPRHRVDSGVPDGAYRLATTGVDPQCLDDVVDLVHATVVAQPGTVPRPPGLAVVAEVDSPRQVVAEAGNVVA